LFKYENAVLAEPKLHSLQNIDYSIGRRGNPQRQFKYRNSTIIKYTTVLDDDDDDNDDDDDDDWCFTATVVHMVG